MIGTRFWSGPIVPAHSPALGRGPFDSIGEMTEQGRGLPGRVVSTLQQLLGGPASIVDVFAPAVAPFLPEGVPARSAAVGPSLRGLPTAAVSLLGAFAPTEWSATTNLRVPPATPGARLPRRPSRLADASRRRAVARAAAEAEATPPIMFEIRMPFKRSEREALTMHGSDLEAKFSRDRTRHARDALTIAHVFRARCGGTFEPAPLASRTADYLRPDEDVFRHAIETVRQRLRPLLVPRWRWRAMNADVGPPSIVPLTVRRISRAVEDFLDH